MTALIILVFACAYYAESYWKSFSSNRNTMTEYWVSQARFYCKFCNCWIADKKSTRESHESSARHKGSVKKHMDEQAKKKKEEEKEQAEIQKELHAIRAAAGAQYEEDLKRGYTITAIPDPVSFSMRSKKDEKSDLNSFYAKFWAQQGVPPPSMRPPEPEKPTIGLDAVPVLANNDINRAYASSAPAEQDNEQVEREALMGKYGPGTGWVVVEKVAREEDPDNQWGPVEVKEEGEGGEYSSSRGDENDEEKPSKKRPLLFDEEEKEEADPWLETVEKKPVKEEEDVKVPIVFKKRKVKQVRKKTSENN